jgi:flagellar biogenesis protein FliO
MTGTPATSARTTERGPMAHRAPRPAARPVDAGGRRLPGPAEATRRRLPEPIARALAAEASELTRYTRRLVPNRRVGLLIGLALLALVAIGGVAGAAEPKTSAPRSALEAFSGTPAPAATAASANMMVVAPSAAPASAAPASTTPAALADDPAFKGPDLFDLGAKTLLVVALLFVTLRVLRRVQGSSTARGTGAMTVIESRTLGPKTQLHLVAVGDRRFVIGQSPSGLVSLGELDAAELPAEEPANEPWAKRSTLDDDAELITQSSHEISTGRRSRLGVSA